MNLESMELQVNFGVDGNLSRYGVMGWGRSDQSYTWTSGPNSALWLPRPTHPGPYILQLLIHPSFAAQKTAVQRLVVSANGQQIGDFEIAKSEQFECRLPWELIDGAEAIAVHFVQLEAASQDPGRNNDDCALAFEYVRLICATEHHEPNPSAAGLPSDIGLIPSSATGAAATGAAAAGSGVVGFVEGLNGVAVEGWALVWPDLSDCVIELRGGDGDVLLGQGRATRERPGLEGFGRGRNNFGFRVALAISSNGVVGNVRVLANGVELPGSPVPVDIQRFAIDFAVEDGHIRGSVADSFNTIIPPKITFKDQDDRFIGAVDRKPGAQGDAVRTSFELPLPPASYGQSEYVVRALIGDEELARLHCDLRLEGYLDTLTAERCSGWLLLPNMPEARLQVEIWRDGKLVGSARCERPRDDVRQIHPLASYCGFEMKLSPRQKGLVPAHVSIRLKNSEFELFGGPFELAPRAALIQAARTAMPISLYPELPLSDAAHSVVRTALKEFCDACRQGSEDYVRVATFPKTATKTDRRLNIIIPIYRDAMITRNCIDSVLRHRNAASDSVILINDCSPEPEIPLILPQYLRQRNVFLLTNEENRGFLQSVNRGLQFCRTGDLVILNSDTHIFAGAFDELYSIAHNSDDIATVTAMSNNATIFSYPHPDVRVEKLDDVSWEELAACALRQNQGVAIETPTGHGFCMLMKREVVDHIGLFNEAFGRGYGEENEWCCRASDLGYRHVVAAGVLVEHKESISFGDEKQKLKHRNGTLLSQMHPEYDALIEDYSARDEMRRGRWALDAVRLEKACAGHDKIALTIQHSLGGGSATAAADIETASGRGSPRNITLTASPEGKMLLAVSQPAIKAVFQPQDVAPLFALLDRLPIDTVMIHQLIGYSSEFIEHLTEYVSEKRSALFLHDYYCFCPRATMIDAADEFCDQSDPAVCMRCIKLGGAHEASALTGLEPQQHRDLFERLMSRVRHVVVPSEDAAARLRPIFPKVPIRAIPHSQSHIDLRPKLATGSFDNIVVLGAVGPHKGSAVLVEIARRAFLSCPNLKFHVIGYTDRDDELLEIGNVTITGIYEPSELSRLVHEANGRVALFLSCWPETFSYTLSEAVQYGLIPLVPDIGAPAQRVRAADFGVVFPFPIEPATVLETIRQVAAKKLHFGNGDPMGFATSASSSILRDLFSGEAAKTSRNSAAQTRISRRSKVRPSAAVA